MDGQPALRGNMKDEDGKVIIDTPALYNIKSAAVNIFNDEDMRKYKDDMQMTLIIKGLYNYIKSQGVEPCFKVKDKK